MRLPLRRVFEAFEKYCRVDNGYVGTADVTRVPPAHDETMQSFFVAVHISATPVHCLSAPGRCCRDATHWIFAAAQETLKYLYLLFSPEELMPLDAYVFNTEAHPLRLPRGIKSQRRKGRLRDKSFAGLLNQT